MDPSSPVTLFARVFLSLLYGASFLLLITRTTPFSRFFSLAVTITGLLFVIAENQNW